MSEALEEKVLVVGAERPGRSDTVRIERVDRRVRNRFGGQVIADSRRVLLVWEPRRLPVYWFPLEDVRTDYLKQTTRTAEGGEGDGTALWDLEVGGTVANDAAWSYPRPDPKHEVLKDHLAFYWSKMDAWFEEDDEVFVHPRDPYHRVDVLNSSRHVRVVVEGEVVAETRRPRLLFETGLPTRYYIPRVDARLELLEPTSTVTACPYKGAASYWSVKAGGQVVKDLVWSYPAPIPECSKIENLVCFFNEKVDLYVDGELQPRPTTQWS